VNSKKTLAILGSGSGSNADALCAYANNDECSFTPALIITTSAEAGMSSVAAKHNVPLAVIPRGADIEAELSRLLSEFSIDALALAGFMRLLPHTTIAQLNGNVFNVHPALLPSFGGKGMYGLHVHTAVLESGVPVTGATIHLVSDQYDEGAVLARSEVEIPAGIDAVRLQQIVKRLEHDLYPKTVSVYLRNR
jgi:phosphoribosylglycinamide formyltransferase-1